MNEVSYDPERAKRRATWAYHLAKHQDNEGVPFPDTADGIARYKASADAYEKEFGIEVDQSQYEKFDDEREKARASWAHHLMKFQDRNGDPFPATEEGITRHKAAVDAYAKEFDVVVDRGQYEGIYSAIRKALGA